MAGSYSNNSSNELTASPTASFAYDYNGNTISKTDSSGTTHYAWDYENRLAAVTLPNSGGTVTFKYDPFGRRIQKSFTTGTNPPTTNVDNYVYNDASLIEEVDPSGAALARYEHGQNVDEPLAMLRGSATSYYHSDGLGSVTSLSNAASALIQSYTFDSFGKSTASSGSLTNPFRYTARDFDTDTNISFYRARYYDQKLGRFMSEDPARFSTGDVNLYRYAWNSPVAYTDPSGRDGLLVGIGVTGGIGDGGAGAAGTSNVSTGFLWGHPNGIGRLGLKGTLLDTIGGFGHGGDSSFPCCSKGTAVGVAASVGASVTYVRGANDPSQLEGPFDTRIIGLGFAEIQIAAGGGVQTYSLGFGPGATIGYMRLNTMTFDLAKTGGRSIPPECKPPSLTREINSVLGGYNF